MYDLIRLLRVIRGNIDLDLQVALTGWENTVSAIQGESDLGRI